LADRPYRADVQSRPRRGHGVGAYLATTACSHGLGHPSMPTSALAPTGVSPVAPTDARRIAPTNVRGLAPTCV